MRLILLAVLALAQTPTSLSAPYRLKTGDVLTVAVNGAPYGGDYQILEDGAVYGLGFGRVRVAGKTWEEAQTALRTALSKFVRPREVTLALRTQRQENVYLIGPSGKGEVAYRPTLTLRQLIASSPIDQNADLTEVQLFRTGGPPQRFNLAELLAKDAAADPTLQPNDVVTLTPTAFQRVWVTGSVKSPGLVRLPASSDPYQAVAVAGGFLREQNAADPLEDDVLLIRRGAETIELPARPPQSGKTPPLQPGDSLIVQPAPTMRFTVAGEVAHPGEFTLRGDADLVRAVATAGGPTSAGTLSGVSLLRGGSMARYDLSGLRTGTPLPKVPLAKDDVVVVAKNERVFYVFGEVNHPGKVVMQDNRTYRLTDALAEAGGITARGVLRRISVARPSPDGRYAVSQYNLDEFLKDGKVAANPEIRPDDMVLFTTSRGITLASATQALSAAFLFQTVTGAGR